MSPFHYLRPLKAHRDHTRSREIRFSTATSQKHRATTQTVDVDLRVLARLVGAQHRDGRDRGHPQSVTTVRYGRGSDSTVDAGRTLGSGPGPTAGTPCE